MLRKIDKRDERWEKEGERRQRGQGEGDSDLFCCLTEGNPVA